jgi:hypothetical protein
MMFRTRHSRSRGIRGQALTALLAFIGLFVIGALGILAFEISRYALAKEQLKNVVDAAALAGQATLATYSPSSANDSQTQTGYASAVNAFTAQGAAVSAAYKIFKQNTILGQPLTNALLPQGVPAQGAPPNPPPNPLPKPSANQAELAIEFLIPTQNAQAGQQGGTSVDQRIVKVTGAYGVAPAFGAFMPLGNMPAFNTATAASPMTDVIDCFDVSGSMDDQTKVTFVRRVWGPQGIEYQPVISGSGGVAEGTIEQILGNPVRGTNVNALPPQGLENANTAPSPLKFSEADPTTRLLRGVTNTGAPPGNRTGQVAPPNTPPTTGGPDTFTDLVVNLDGNSHFGGFVTPNGYSFPNVGVLVEAERGNLENQVLFNAAGLAGNPNFVGIAPRAGYKAMGYELAAQQLLLPFVTARSAAMNFSYVVLHTNNCQLGELSYSDHVGTTDLSTFTAPNVSTLYPQADSPTPGIYMLPNQYEIPMSDQLFFIYKELCTSAAARVCGQTSNVHASLSRAVANERAAIDWLSDPTHHRPNADRAIVLMTNTAPTDTEMAPARADASRAHSLGIPIYVVGLAETPGTQTVQYNAFNDVNSNSSSGGICAIAGHGSRFFQVTSQADLSQAFGNVMRQMVKLVQ